MIDINAKDFTIGVVGAGAMGSGIAQVALTGGIRVILHDTDGNALGRARTAVFARLDRLVEKGEASAAEIDAAKSGFALARDLAQLAPCRIVIEAIVEKL